MFAGNFAPRGFMMCNGQLLSIQQYSALFSLLGTYYGGDGQRTFALPNLQGYVPIGWGSAPGQPTYVIGQTGGSANTTLQIANMPNHSHTLNGDQAAGGKVFPGPNHILGGASGAEIYSVNAPNTTMSPKSIGNAGGSQPFSLMPPYLAISYIIAVTGIFPSRNRFLNSVRAVGENASSVAVSMRTLVAPLRSLRFSRRRVYSKAVEASGYDRIDLDAYERSIGRNAQKRGEDRH